MSANGAEDAKPVLSARQALFIIAMRAGGCEKYTSGYGACFPAKRDIYSIYGADEACSPCIAWAALGTGDKP